MISSCIFPIEILYRFLFVSANTFIIFSFSNFFNDCSANFRSGRALETKAVDGQENPFNTILSSKFYEVQKYLTVTNHVYSPWIVTVSKRWWDGLSQTEQNILMEAAKKARDFERQDTREEAARALAELKDKGMQINEVDPAEVQRMREQAAPAIQKVVDTVGQQLFDQVQAEAEKAAL